MFGSERSSDVLHPDVRPFLPLFILYHEADSCLLQAPDSARHRRRLRKLFATPAKTPRTPAPSPSPSATMASARRRSRSANSDQATWHRPFPTPASSNPPPARLARGKADQQANLPVLSPKIGRAHV